MSVSPFSARPTLPGGSTPDAERKRARLVIVICIVGITAALVAYAVSPGVRHVVGHAAHSVRHAVSHIFDPDAGAHHHRQHLHLVSPLHAAGGASLAHHHRHASASKSP